MRARIATGTRRPAHAMLYKFKSQACADLIMTEPVGSRLLQLIGHEPSPRGILQVAAMPAAIAALQAAIEADERARRGAPADDDQAADEAEVPRERISLRRRAWPFLEMMRRCLAEREDIVWGV